MKLKECIKNLSTKKWTEEEIEKLVLKELGVDVIYPIGFQVFVKIVDNLKESKYGLAHTHQEKQNAKYESRICKVLRIGDEAFIDQRRFPLGQNVFIGGHVMFNIADRDIFDVNGNKVAYIHDNLFLGHVSDLTTIKCSHDTHLELRG